MNELNSFMYLFLIFWVGVFGFMAHLALGYNASVELKRRVAIATWVWFVFWSGPPLLRLWVMGVAT